MRLGEFNNIYIFNQLSFFNHHFTYLFDQIQENEI